MEGPFHLLQQLADVVVVEARAEAQGTRAHAEGFGGGRFPPKRQTSAKHLIHDLLERLPLLPRLLLQLPGYVFVKSECGSHIMMLSAKHHDVKGQVS